MKFKNSNYWVRHSPLIAARDSTLIILVAFVFRYALQEFIQPYVPFHFFLVGCFIIAFRYGYKVALVALLISTLLGIYFFIAPYNSFDLPTIGDIIQIVNFDVVAVLAILLIERLQRTIYSQRLLINVMRDQNRTELFKENDLLLKLRLINKTPSQD